MVPSTLTAVMTQSSSLAWASSCLNKKMPSKNFSTKKSLARSLLTQSALFDLASYSYHHPIPTGSFLSFFCCLTALAATRLIGFYSLYALYAQRAPSNLTEEQESKLTLIAAQNAISISLIAGFFSSRFDPPPATEMLGCKEMLISWVVAKLFQTKEQQIGKIEQVIGRRQTQLSHTVGIEIPEEQENRLQQTDPQARDAVYCHRIATTCSLVLFVIHSIWAISTCSLAFQGFPLFLLETPFFVISAFKELKDLACFLPFYESKTIKKLPHTVLGDTLPLLSLACSWPALLVITAASL